MNNQPPQNSSNNKSNGSSYPAPSAEDKARTQANRKSLKRFILALLAIGLILGGIVSIGIVGILDRFGLTDNTPSINEIRE